MNNILYLLPIIASFFWALTNIVDKHLISNYAKDQKVGALVIFSSIIGIPFAFIFFILAKGNINSLDISQKLILITSGLLYISAIIPYLNALKDESVSTIAPLFLLTPFTSVILGWIFLNETLILIQIIGLLLIILGSMIINFDEDEFANKKLKIKFKPIILMFIASIFMSMNYILFKFVTVDTEFWTGIFWQNIGMVIFGLLSFIFVKSYRNDFNHMFASYKTKIFPFNTINEIFTIVGDLAFNFSLLLMPVVIADTIAQGFQPVMILFIEFFVIYFIAKNNADKIDFRKTLNKKWISIMIMITGLVLLNLT